MTNLPTKIEGELSVSDNLRVGGEAIVSGNAIVKHNLVVEGWLEAKNIKYTNKGVFLTLAKLKEAYPHPALGWFAGVGLTSPFDLYLTEDANGEVNWLLAKDSNGTTGKLSFTMNNAIVEQLKEDVDRLWEELNFNTKDIDTLQQDVQTLETINATTVTKMDNLETRVAQEAIIRDSVDRTMAERINTEESRRIQEDDKLSELISDGNTALDNKITTEALTRKNNDDALEAKIFVETNTRKGADDELAVRIGREISDRMASVSNLNDSKLDKDGFGKLDIGKQYQSIVPIDYMVDHENALPMQGYAGPLYGIFDGGFIMQRNKETLKYQTVFEGDASTLYLLKHDDAEHGLKRFDLLKFNDVTAMFELYLSAEKLLSAVKLCDTAQGKVVNSISSNHDDNGFTIIASTADSEGNVGTTSATIPEANTSENGLMSKADKVKLNGIEAGAQVNTVTSVAGRTGAVTLAKSDVGLNNVDNTSDKNKPVSEATQAALDNINGDITDLYHQIDLISRFMIDYCVASWDTTGMNPVALEVRGNPDFLKKWEFFLLDTTDNTNKTTRPVGKLMRNNLLRFADGRFAPTVGITEAMRAECDVALYLDAAHTQKVCDAGAFDAEAFYNEHGLCDLYDASGAKVRQLLPWETTETKYTIGIGREDTVYLLDNVKGKSGKVWSGIFSKPVVFDGIDVSAYPLVPTAISPCPVTTVGGKARCFFYLYEGETNCKSSEGSGGYCTLFANGRTYPRTEDVTQAKNMQIARANNADTHAPYPFAEGGYHAFNVYQTCLEVLHGTRALHDTTFFGNGISDTQRTNNYELRRTTNSIFYRAVGSNSWIAGSYSYRPDIYGPDGEKVLYFSALLSNQNAKEQSMESQMAYSFAVERGIAEDTDFTFYGATYWWLKVPTTLSADYMNARVFKAMAQTISAYNEAGEPTDFELEVVLAMSLFGGANLSGDIFAYYGGGSEIVAFVDHEKTEDEYNYPITLYCEPNQEKWLYETKYCVPFDTNFEDVYPKVRELLSVGPNGFVQVRQPYTPFGVKPGGITNKGQCYYQSINGQWNCSVGTRLRAGLRLRGNVGLHCSPRLLYATTAVSSYDRILGGSAQALLQIDAVPPQAE